ncbi:MAG: xanthine dehydrogenase family protein molybdopterin-binding subunit [Acidimicrobiales bacterium]|jgi:carbon-monoxide dehydrogenase large subunit
MVDENVLFITGQATYIDDLDVPILAGAAHAVFVRSTAAHARIRVDLDSARGAPGVLVAIAAADNPILPTLAYSPDHPLRFAQPLLAEHKVRYVGEPVAVVVAATRAQAVDAAELVVIDYDELTPVLSTHDALFSDVRLFDLPDQARLGAHSGIADTETTNVIRTHVDDGLGQRFEPAVFENADVVIEHEFRNPRQLAAPIECRGATATWTDDGHLHVWVSTQTPHSYRSRIAPMYDLALSSIHVIAGPFVGGGFGGKGAPGPEEQLIPYLARLVERPVRWVESRTENLMSAPHGRAEDIHLWLAGTSDGDLQAVKVQMHKDAGAYASSGAGLPNRWTAPMLAGTYSISHTEFEQITHVTNRPPVAALRGAGRGPVIAALERAVDMFASEIGMDPAELRRRNLLTAADMPYASPTGALYDDADYAEALERVLVLADYTALRATQAVRRATPTELQIGIGIASYNHRTCGGGGESALVRINADGSATVVTGTTSQGQGHEATWRKIASGELGIAPERITVIEGNTDEISTGVGAIGSRSVQTAGLAIHEASADVVSQAATLAAQMLEAAEADVVLDRQAGTFHVVGTPSRSLGWADLAIEMQARDEQLSCDHVYENGGKDVYPSGCHVAVVQVDAETGEWKLIQYAAVDDAGVRVNDQIVQDQLRGGIALGAAQVMGEEALFDDAGNPLTTSFLDYQIASIDQFCQIDLEAQVVPSSFNAGGYKAVGESGPIGATPAVHNAVLDAIAHLGVRHIDIPCTPQKVWQAINSA